MDEFNRLRQLVDQAADDLGKAMGGNAAAGTRVRKIMQDVRAVAGDIRKKILELRKPKTGSPSGTPSEPPATT